MTADWLEELRSALYPTWPELARAWDIGPAPAVGWKGVPVPALGLRGPEVPRPDLIVAQTCIDHSAADPGKLAVSVLTDLVFGHLAAHALGAPLLICLGTGEELHVVPRGQRRAAGWQAVVRRIGGVLESLAPPPSGRRVIETGEPEIWDLAREVVEADDIPDEDLDGLYRLHPPDPFPRATPYTYFYRYYRHNVVRYRAPFLSAVSGTPARQVLVVEDAHQLKAVGLAAARNAPEGTATSHLMTPAAPSRSLSGRASRATGEDFVPLPATAAGPLPTGGFWQAVDAGRRVLCP